MNPLTLIPSGIQAATDLVGKWLDRKAAEKSAKAKLEMAKEVNDYKIELTQSEWEAVAVKYKEKTWTDEYATVSVLSIFNLMVIGGLEMAVRGDAAVIMAGVINALNAMEAVNINVGQLIEVVVYAAVGIYAYRRLK